MHYCKVKVIYSLVSSTTRTFGSRVNGTGTIQACSVFSRLSGDVNLFCVTVRSVKLLVSLLVKGHIVGSRFLRFSGVVNLFCVIVGNVKFLVSLLVKGLVVGSLFLRFSDDANLFCVAVGTVKLFISLLVKGHVVASLSTRCRLFGLGDQSRRMSRELRTS